MAKIIFQKTTPLIFALLVFALSCNCALAKYESVSYEIINESNSANIKTEVSAEANTGNNESSGSEIITGSASAESKVEVKVSSSDSGGEEEKNNEIKIEAKAEANGEKVEAKVDSAGDENIVIKKEAGDERNQASLEIEIANEIQEPMDAGQNLLDTEEEKEKIEKISAENSKIKNTFASIKNTTKSFFENIANKIKSLFL